MAYCKSLLFDTNDFNNVLVLLNLLKGEVDQARIFVSYLIK